MIKLLLVDDERIIREGIEAMIPFDELGIELTGSCENAFDAMDRMIDEVPDILLTDVKMPPMNGLELIERALKINPAMQCVVLSGYSDFEYARKAIQIGVREYLLKPCSQQELIMCLKKQSQEIRDRRSLKVEKQRDQMTRIVTLAESLADLMPVRNHHEIKAYQVKEVARLENSEELLREALAYLITHYEQKAERGLSILRKAYGNDVNVCESIAHVLSDLKLQPQRRRGFVTEMCDYLHEHYANEELSLQYLAEQVIHMQSNYIGREFKKEVGYRVSEYLLEIRMEKAKELLLDGQGGQRVQEIAEAVGLGRNTQYFSTLFRKYTGYSPSEYSKSTVK